ncbi:hypothetical protein P4639_14515 [Priestia megaterium]|uniref:hypothetical protein n=1 Tax=Priestia megaterium TaxID=1404 RepID=UPI002E24A667|nr:hypothetical protein [Priestia megaterium]
MPYNLKYGRTEFKGGKNILASTHLQFREVGGTLDATKFPVGLVEVGTCLGLNGTSGKFEPFTDAGTFTDFAILNVDFENDGENDTVVGELIIRGSVYGAKLVGVTTKFKTATPLIRYVYQV